MIAIRLSRVLACVLVVGLAPPARAAEIDSVTGRGLALEDAAPVLDALATGFLREAAVRANALGSACDEEALYAEIRRAIAFPFVGHAVTQRLDASEDLDSRRVPFDESIYRDLGILDAVSVHWKDLSSVLRVGDDLVGTDKLGHFFVEGFEYFAIAYERGQGVEAAMDWGERAERSYFGLLTTGVYSHADLVANFEGMRFWLRVLGAKRDPLEGGYRNRPYVVCSRPFFGGERSWRVRRDVDLARYVSPAWDEAVNCPRYRNGEIEAMVERRIADAGADDGRDYRCPVAPDACVAARARYGRYAERLLHPDCLIAEREGRPWWKLW